MSLVAEAMREGDFCQGRCTPDIVGRTHQRARHFKVSDRQPKILEVSLQGASVPPLHSTQSGDIQAGVFLEAQTCLINRRVLQAELGCDTRQSRSALIFRDMAALPVAPRSGTEDIDGAKPA